MKDFIIKCVVVTLCACFFMHYFYPRTVYIDTDHRYDRFTGKAEYRAGYCGSWLNY